jgi:hypothetical protein
LQLVATYHFTYIRLKMWTLEEVIDVLHREGIRATYGAVAGVVGGTAIGLMVGRPMDPRHSWVVAAGNDLPTGYNESQMDPLLRQSPVVLDTANRLLELLDRQFPL